MPAGLDDPELVAAKARTAERLRAAISGQGRTTDHRMLAAWSVAHGFATLRRSGNLDRLLDGRDAEAEFGEVVGLVDLRS